MKTKPAMNMGVGNSGGVAMPISDPPIMVKIKITATNNIANGSSVIIHVTQMHIITTSIIIIAYPPQNIGAGNCGGSDNPIKHPPTIANTHIMRTAIRIPDIER